MEITWRVISWEGQGENGEKVTGIKKHNLYIQNRQGDVKNNIENGEAKELICMTHGHELRAEGSWREGRYQAEGGKGEKIVGTTVII